MVFESLVVELINKFVGDYVENLDASQLKLGIWGGDAVLENLDLKESALDELDLPVKIKAGHVGKLTLKIPWKNLYTEPVVAELDGVYALAVPNAGIKYNAEKEEKVKQDAKQKKLKQIDEIKKAEAEKDKPKEEKQDSFVEKMATQVIKNLQIKVNNIHVRYEDRHTNPKRPFAIGITLHELLFQTTDEKWAPCVIKEAVTQIYKLIRLDSLGVYWNSCTDMYDGRSRAEILTTLKSNIASGDSKTEYQYCVKPISSVAHLKLNTKPEQTNFSLPKIFLTIVFDNIGIALSKFQYDDVLEMLESFERMGLLGIYRKYKPDVPLHKHAKEWWHYAYAAVLEETVRRRRRMFSWQHISEHRLMMKKYRQSYVKKLDSKRVGGDVTKTIEECEKYLDVFSITIMRQQAELEFLLDSYILESEAEEEAARLGAKREQEKGSGWFGGWFGGGQAKAADSSKTGDIQEKFYEHFTPEEKAKLYGAIGYEENESDPTLPKEYIAVRLVTKLSNVSISLLDNTKKEPQILKLKLKEVFSSIGQRPAASAVQIEAKIDSISMLGTVQNGVKPKMIKSQVQDSNHVYSLLDAKIETNPLDGGADTRVKLNSRPLEITYDACTVNQLAVFFKPPESVRLKQLSQAAMATFDDIKEQSATGLQHAIEQRKYTEITVDLMSSYIIVPEGGFMKPDVKLLVLDLGTLKVTTKKSEVVEGEKQKSLHDVMAEAYDKFNIELTGIQIMFVNPGDDWQAARNDEKSKMHILYPISILLNLHKCMIARDPRMAKMKVFGEMPLLSLAISDFRLQEILSMVDSIPLPESGPPEPESEDLFKGPSAMVLVAGDEQQMLAKASKLITAEEATAVPKKLERAMSSEYVNFTDMELRFEIKKVVLNVSEKTGGEDVPLLRLVVERIGAAMDMRTFDMKVEAHISSLKLEHLRFKECRPASWQKESDRRPTTYLYWPRKNRKYYEMAISLVGTPYVKYSELLHVVYLKANKKGPEFDTVYGKTEQSIEVEFAGLELMLHQEAILSLMEFAQHIMPADKPAVVAPEVKPSEGKADKKEEESKEKKPARKKREKPVDPDLIDVKIKAEMKALYIAVATEKRLITDIQIEGIDAFVAVQKAKTTIGAVLRDMKIADPTKNTHYPKIMGIEGSEVLKLDVVAYNNGTEGEKYADMSCVDTKVEVTMGCIRLVFLNKFVMDLLGFLDNFQAAKDKMKEAGDAVAEYSAEAAKSLQENASRIALNIKMKAPVIIVPQKSTSKNVLMADLGNLDLHNGFHLAGKLPASGMPAVLDKMEIVLTSLKLSRAIMLTSGVVEAECLILEPITISLKIARNLSAAWFHDLPDIDVGGTLEAISVKMSQGDYTIIMKMLDENLKEGQSPDGDNLHVKTSVGSTTQAGSTITATTVTPVTASTLEAKPKKEPSQDVVKTTEAAYSKMKFNFVLKSLAATLYTGDSNLKKGICQRETSRALGKFELQGFILDGQMMSDTSMVTTVILKDTILDDLRPSKQRGITRMISRSASKSKSANMIDVNFNQNYKQDKNVDVRVSSLLICVCSEFLMTLADFFTKGLPKAPEQPAKPDATKVVKTEVKPAVEAAPPPEGEMVIQLVIEKPEIILIEDQLNKSTNSLTVDMGLNFHMRNTPEVQTMQATIQEVQIRSCMFDKRDQSGIQILQPCDISFHSSAPYGKGHHMDVSLSDLVLNISPATIRTLTSISSGFATKPEEEEGTKREKIPDNLWDIKQLADVDLWYLKLAENDVDSSLDVATEATEELVNGEVTPEETRGEQMILSLPSIVMKLEGGIDHRTVPLLIVESSFQGEVRDWSSKLYVESSLRLEVAYYNERLAVWEPLLEPVIENSKPRRWELELEVMQNDDLPPPIEEGEDTVVLPPPKMTISVKSTDSLQLTMTKTCLEVLQNLGKAFGDAYNLVESDAKAGEMDSPYVIQNQTGLDVILKLDPLFEPPPNTVSGKVKLPQGSNLPLSNKISGSPITKASMIKSTQEGQERKLIFQIEESGAAREITIKRAEKRLFQINQKSHSGETWAVVAQTDTNLGQKVVSLRSIVQVYNHLEVAIEVYYKGDTKVESCGIAQPGMTFSVPLKVVYCVSGELLFRPVDGYDISSENFKWLAAENEGVKQFSCASRQPGSTALCFNVATKVENIYFENGTETNAKSYVLNIHPTVILHNLLPFPIYYVLEGNSDQKKTLNKGENCPLLNAAVNQSTLELSIPDYMGKEYVGNRILKTSVPELSIWTFETQDGNQNTTMDFGLYCKMNEGSFDVSLYCPYWMINKTGQSLSYRGGEGDTEYDHPADYDGIVMFVFKSKSLFGSKKKEKNGKSESEKKSKVKEMKQSGKAQLKIGSADWSDKFSLDTVNCSGTVQCKSAKRVFEVGVTNNLTQTGLTKVITFTPFYMLLNTAETSILCSEVAETDDWIEVVPGKCLPFWPEQTGKDLTMKAKFKDTPLATTPFQINKAHTTCLRLDNEYGGLNVECVVTESAMVTTFTEYALGLAAIQIVNHVASGSITFNQKGLKTVHTLNPMETVLYTWEDALGKRELVWKCGDKEFTNDLSQDGLGDFFVDTDTKAYWVSFLDGMQRVMLVSQDLALITMAQQAGEFERIEQEISVSIQGMGLSLVNNYNQSEIAFLGITSSGIIWEEKRKRFKPIKIKDSLILEQAYQKYITEITIGNTPPARVHLENKMEVDFTNYKDNILMLKPNKRTIRRSFVDGIWIQYKTSPLQVQLHAKINRLQLDNQLTGAVFPTVVAPLPPPKSVAAESVPKPFTEISLMQRKHEHSSVSQIKYFKVLIQEFSMKVDQGFLNAILDLFAADVPISRDEETAGFLVDCNKNEEDLMIVVGVSLAQEQKNFYDYLHFSPIKIHLSFSLQGGGDSDKPTQIHANVLNVFLQSVGVVLTDIQDVVFKLGYFERCHNFYNKSQLTNEMTRHYAGQAIKQMYVLVLGLDVLGNPFGLLRGLSEGAVDLFYEPYQGAIQGPEEFAEGLALGVRSLFGHAVGGAAGAVSRITGTLGKGIAALTLDDDYQKKRREQLNKRPASAREGFARGGKGLVMGVFDGVTGIVRKPMEGAKQEGVSGFFKGMGKGLVGVVTRPTSGVIDFASSSFEGIRRLAEMSDEIKRLRPPRRFHKDKIVRPYNHQEAEGYAILHETEKGKFATTDEYVAHVVISKDGKLIFLVLTKRVLLAKRGEIFGSWDAEWMFTWAEIKELPKKTNKGIEIVLKEKEKKLFSFGHSATKKEVHILDPKQAEWIIGKIEEAMARAAT
ncbi:vacuolar protein sorting-associated protein 13A-like isoform X2 [Gigantopelta aegis]|uniref:vacuolar protein sorting-associated protein 13A-like isoform X2 n=1 Tax=Gigantopelta aegis TaxID=1735272 RepID=UPI001B8876B6|nr:vacuolar protein sorting-associated protein 13A-like isoform X2 [Gigantopelta aegis]